MNEATMRHIAWRQRHGDVVALVDVEGSFRPDVLRAQGVELRDLLVAQPDTMDDVHDILAGFARSGVVDLVVLNGCAAPEHHAGLEVVEVLPPPTFNLYTQGTDWTHYHTLARGASAKNCVQWVCAHANHGEGERLMRAFRALPDGGEEFVCAWVVAGGSGEVVTHPDVTVPVRYHRAARRVRGGDR